MKGSSTRQRLERAILRISNRAVRGGEAPDIDRLAIRLSSKYPQSGMTLSEIQEEIERTIQAKKHQQTERPAS